MTRPAEPRSVERVTSRVYRFIRAVRPGLSNIDRAIAEEWLSPEQLALFLTQSEADQRHAIAVARLLLTSGLAGRDLIVAALLHDVGKRGARFTPAHRTLIVILESYAPRLLQWLSRGRRNRWLAPFAVHAAHARAGSRLAHEAGASLRTAHLIRMHHEPAPGADQELAALRWADDHA